MGESEIANAIYCLASEVRCLGIVVLAAACLIVICLPSKGEQND